MKNQILAIILLIIILLICFYNYTKVNHVENCEVQKTTPVESNEDFKVAILMNYNNYRIESRVVNTIIHNAVYYIYLDKNNYHYRQLNDDNRVSLLTYFKEGNIYKQILLYGILDEIKEFDGIVLYRLIIDNRKITVTRDDESHRRSNYTYDNRDPKESKLNFDTLVDIATHIKENY